MIYTI